MINKGVGEAVIYIGNEENFENINLALIAGEKLNVDGKEKFHYKVNSLFIK